METWLALNTFWLGVRLSKKDLILFVESGAEHAAGFTYPIWPGSTQKDLQDVAGRNTSRAIFLLPSVTEIWTQIGGRNWTDGQSIDHGLLVMTLLCCSSVSLFTSGSKVLDRLELSTLACLLLQHSPQLTGMLPMWLVLRVKKKVVSSDNTNT